MEPLYENNEGEKFTSAEIEEMEKSWEKINEEKIAEVERTTYQGQMPAHNKATLRTLLKKEDKEVLRSEMDNSHSPVGDEYNMREVNEH